MQRRNFMRGILGTGALLPLSQTSLFASTQKANNHQTPASSPQLVFFKSEDDEFKFLNLLGTAHYKFSDIGELLAIRNRVNEEDASSFVKAYIQFADWCKMIADDCIKKGLTISARDAYLRASSYYYAATDYLDAALQADLFLDIFKTHRDCWRKAANLMDFDYEEFEIPYEGTSLSGFFMRHKGDKSPRPLCIFNNGSDGPITTCWTFGGAGLFERGYNLMTFDGPGQGSSLFEKKLYFRYDWEKVITPVIDSIINRKEVAKNKIVLLGISQGGYWVPRAAAFEKRLKAIIVDPGVTNVASSWLASLPKPLQSLLQSGTKDKFNAYLEEGFKQSPQSAAVYNFRARPFGMNTPFDVYSEVQKYNLTGIAGKIECAVLITSPEDEQFWPGQSQELYDMINSPKQLIPFTAAQGANYHCEPKARVLWEQQVLDKLDAIVKTAY